MGTDFLHVSAKEAIKSRKDHRKAPRQDSQKSRDSSLERFKTEEENNQSKQQRR